MKTTKIHFANVQQIIVQAPGTDSDVEINIIWKKVGTKLVATYEYRGLEPQYRYCPYCGNIWMPSVHPTTEDCGCCDGVNETMDCSNLDEINNYIWNCLSDKDPMDVIFVLEDGTRQLFTLREK